MVNEFMYILLWYGPIPLLFQTGCLTIKAVMQEDDIARYEGFYASVILGFLSASWM